MCPLKDEHETPADGYPSAGAGTSQPCGYRTCCGRIWYAATRSAASQEETVIPENTPNNRPEAAPAPAAATADSWLFGWDATPGIVSVWADRRGRALIWQRHGAQVTCAEDRFRPWLFAATLEDLA